MTAIMRETFVAAIESVAAGYSVQENDDGKFSVARAVSDCHRYSPRHVERNSLGMLSGSVFGYVSTMFEEKH